MTVNVYVVLLASYRPYMCEWSSKLIALYERVHQGPSCPYLAKLH
jgi:hypothetical protein